MKNSHKTYLYIFLIAALYIFAVQINRMERDNETSEAAVNRSQDMIGNHTYTHVQMNTLSCEAAIAEVKKTSELIESIVGEGTGYLRPPYGECTKQMKKELDMFIVLWDVDPLDWSIQNEDAVVEKVLRDVKDGDIILLHDIFDTSVRAAIRIVDALQKEGYEFVTVEELMFP